MNILLRTFIAGCTLLTATVAMAADYTYSPADTVALKQRLGDGSLRPGDRVLLSDGTYRLGDVDFVGHGALGDSITLAAINPGKVVISGPLKMRIFGEYLKVDGLFFNDAWASGFCMIEMRRDKDERASHCRITNCVIDECNDPQKSELPAPPGQLPMSVAEYWVGLYGTNNRVDHCYFANKRIGGLVVQIWLDENCHVNNHQVDHNLFGFRKPYGGNGAEIIRVGHSWSSQLESHAIIENNVFLHCNGENEIISVKSCNNILRRNLFFESQGGLVCRHGHYNVLQGNTIIGNNERNSCGIRVINQGHTVSDNYVARVAQWGLLVRVGVYERPTPETDIKAEPLTSYHRAENVDIAYNHFIDCGNIELASGRGDKMPRNVRIAYNDVSGDKTTLRLIRPEESLSGFYFLDNKCYHPADNSVWPDGFTPIASPADYSEMESQRVMAAINDIGPRWYDPNIQNLKYIADKYKK